VPDGGSIQAALDAQPSGATICLSGTYSASAELRPKSGQTIRGPATVNSVGYHRAFSLVGLTNVTVRDLTIIGSHPSPGTFSWGTEHAHGVAINGGSGHRLLGLRIEKMQGDCIYVDQWARALATDLTITGLVCRQNGRMGIAIVGGQRVTATNSAFHDIAWSPLNIEPEWHGSTSVQGAIDIRFLGGQVTGWQGGGSVTGGNTQFAYIGTPGQIGTTAPVVQNVEIADFTIAPTANRGMWVRVDPYGYRVRNVTVRNIRAEGVVSAPYIGSPVRLIRVDGATITGNHQSVSGTTTFVQRIDATGVTSSGNTGTGITGQG
jgi:hypothetical protein